MHSIYEHFMLDALRILRTDKQAEIFLLQGLQFDGPTGSI